MDTATRPLVVLKFGGTSLGTPARIRRAAKRVRRHSRTGAQVLVVVSAAGHTTDRIAKWLDAVAPLHRATAGREHDRALATGEELSASLLAAALNELGVRADSLRGGEAGLEAAGRFGAGELVRLDAERLWSLLDEGVVPVVAGFQALRADGETVTLGRGGSDTTATFIAGTLGAGTCHIITDVDAVYDRDPRRDPSAQRLPQLPHDALLALVEAGAEVVHPDAARHARRFGTPLHIYGFDAPPAGAGGTYVGPGAAVSPAQLQLRTVPTVCAVPTVPGLRIGLAGCGVVGSELVRLFQRHAAAIEHAHGVRPELVRVLVREPGMTRAVDVAAGLFTNDVDEFLSTPADVVVEALGGLDPAEGIARATLARGGRFVTANKALIGAAGADLVALAGTAHGGIDFEAAVGGGIPIVRVLRDALAQGPVHRIRAILNGTCNYILTLLERGVPFHVALREAQNRGFAEADSTRDLDGTDAADKIRILAWLAWGVAPQTVAVRCRGILPDPDALAQAAAAMGGCVRLIAECAVTAGELSAAVEPVIVPHASAFGRTTEEQNHVSVDFDWSAPLALSGPGAGGLPTAAALLGDVLRACAPLADRVPADVAPAVEDGAHSWVVTAAQGRTDLLDRLGAVGLEAVPGPSTPGHERCLVAHCGWSRLESAFARVAAAGPRPLAIRLDPALTVGDVRPDHILVADAG